MEWMNLIVHNTAEKPTFVRGDTKSFIDVRCLTQQIVKTIADWKVLDVESLNDHAFIYFKVKDKYIIKENKKKNNKDKLGSLRNTAKIKNR